MHIYTAYLHICDIHTEIYTDRCIYINICINVYIYMYVYMYIYVCVHMDVINDMIWFVLWYIFIHQNNWKARGRTE